MKVRIVVKPERFETTKAMLEQGGFVVSEDGDFVFKEAEYVPDSLLGEKNGEYHIIPFTNIVIIESFGRLIVLHTLNETYEIREKLFELEQLLDEQRFFRINKSQIVAKTGIDKIKPDLSGRITLSMKNRMIVGVSRTYRRAFQRFIGF